ncbi:MAG: type II secretion system F family protein [Candidatus Micrarchaeota archaeon]|nr:type II secretion system F family protein [Candidatus Micrarchaeota archaeon]
MTKIRIPMLLLPPKVAKVLAHFFYGFASRMLPGMPYLEKELYKLDSDLSATEYLSLSALNAFIYFIVAEVLAYLFAYRAGLLNPLAWGLGAGAVSAFLVFAFCLAYPRWLNYRKVAQMDRDLLFAARHLRIQTTAGVPLFDALVSASHGYGKVSEEFHRIVTEVQAGTNLADALEDSAVRNPSYYYSRILWQMSNAVKAGTDIGPVLSEIVEFLAEEQRIEMRNYGAQLNTLAIMYLMVCIIVPTISLIFLMVISSFVSVPITDSVFLLILGALVFVQYMFIGLIESRRPAVSI